MQQENQAFLALFSRLLGNWQVSEDRVRSLSREFLSVFKEVGAARFSVGVDAIIHTSDLHYFPNISEFRGYVPKTERPESCGKCTSGWARVPDYAARKAYKDETATAMIRCECRRGPTYERWAQQ